MKWGNLFKSIVLLFAASIFFACGSSGGGSSTVGDGTTSGGDGTGTVSVGLTDSTTDQYLGVYITIADLQICFNRGESNDNDCNWRSLECELIMRCTGTAPPRLAPT